MKKALSLVLLISLILTILVGCIGGNSNDNQNNDGNQNGNTDSGNSSDGDSSSDTTTKQIPVYQGMSISSVKESAARIKPHHMMAGTNNGNGNNGDNGNHYGQYKGDHSDKDNDPDDEKPFPDNDENENIEEEIKSSLEVIGSPDTIYYASVGQDIYIHIHIHNPDSFEIMSFTLNGKKYSSYMFEDGSDMETIILKYNVGEASGIIDYTIDAIKYVDGTEIKDVIIDGDKTVRAGVRKDNQVVANVSDIKIGTDSISFNVNVKDNDNLIAFADGKIHAVLYDGFEIINQVELNSGENQVCFDGLKTSSTYQYAIVGHYDNLNGNGFGMNVLYKDAFMTEAIVLFDNIVIGQEYISFDFAWHNDYQNSNITSLNLYQDEASMNEQSVNSRYIDGLLSGSTYFLVAEFDHNGKTESIQLEFTTFAKGVPGIALNVNEVTKTSINFSINEIDEEEIGEVTKIELVHKNGTVVADNVDVREFTGLFSGNSYTIRVTYSYDLNDGNGVQTVIKEAKALTKHNEAPVVSIINVVATTDSISFEVEQSYTDVPAKIVRIELVSHGQIVQTITDSYEFTGLFSDHDYTIGVVFEYDLNNGYGIIETLVEYDITTVKKPTPNAWVQVDYYTLDTIGYDAYNLDNESILSVYVELIDSNGNVIAKQNVVSDYMEIEGLNLLSNSKYILRFTFTYDLNDGKGVQTFTYDHDVLTVTLDKPVLSLTNEEITVNSIKADLLIKEGFNTNYTPCYKTFIECTFEIYKGTVLVATSDSVDFSNLTSYTDYTIKCIYSYDLKDGSGVKTESVDFTYTTQPYIDVVECKIANTSAVSEGDTIFMQVTIDNPMNMTVESVVVNGETYNVTGSSTANKLFVEIVYNGQFAGGDTYLKIEKIKAKLNGNTYIIDSKSQLSDNVFINGKIEVVNVEFVNENFEPIYYSLGDSRIFVLLTLDNPTGYHIDDMKHSDFTSSAPHEFTKIDDNHWYYEYFWNWEGEMDEVTKISVASISYSNEYIQKTMTVDISSNSIMLISDETPIYVSTPEDLKKMNAMRYYVLANDIDLSGMEWHGSSFYGVLDGNGYSIKNMSFVGTLNSQDSYLGLFNQASGVIRNLNIKNATIIANDPEENHTIRAGFFVAMSTNFIYFDNCSIDENSILSITAKDSSEVYAGGFIGYANSWDPITPPLVCLFNNCTNNSGVSGECAGGFVGNAISSAFINCINNGSISGAWGVGGFTGNSGKTTFKNCNNSGNISGKYSIGGLSGMSSNSTFENCINTGSVSGSQDVGGFVGRASSSITFTNCTNNGCVNENSCWAGGFVGVLSYANATFINCINSGSISGHASAGGFNGALYDANATFINCINSGSLSVDLTSPERHIGGFVSESDDWNATFNNAYSLTKGNGLNGDSCTVEQLNSKSFYTDTLGWSEDVWDLSELDIENGKYPKLK